MPVTVEGWAKPAWADPAALETSPRGRHRTTLLSPFDSLIWERARTERIFGFTHRLEAYVPKPKRVHGYFAMPLLAGGRLLGRVDPAREGTTLVARQVSLDRPQGGARRWPRRCGRRRAGWAATDGTGGAAATHAALAERAGRLRLTERAGGSRLRRLTPAPRQRISRIFSRIA